LFSGQVGSLGAGLMADHRRSKKIFLFLLQQLLEHVLLEDCHGICQMSCNSGITR